MMKKLEIVDLESIQGGGDRCEFVAATIAGFGGILCSAIVTAPLGIVLVAVGVGSYLAGGCGRVF